MALGPEDTMAVARRASRGIAVIIGCLVFVAPGRAGPAEECVGENCMSQENPVIECTGENCLPRQENPVEECVGENCATAPNDPVQECAGEKCPLTNTD